MKQLIRRNWFRALIVGVFFAIGYFGTFFIVTQPIIHEVSQCKEVVMNIYDESISEVPDNIIVTVTDSKIEAKMKDSCAKVIGTIENDQIETDDGKQLVLCIVVNLLMGTIFSLIWAIIDARIQNNN